MSAQDCIREILEASDGRLSLDQVTEIAEELDKVRAEYKNRADLDSVEDAMMTKADEIVRGVDIAKQIEKRNRLINIRARETIFRYVDEIDKMNGRPDLAMMALLVGADQPIPNARLSVAALGNSISEGTLGAMRAELRTAKSSTGSKGVLYIFEKPEFEAVLARELEAVTNPNLTPGHTGNRDAATAAAIIDKYRKAVVTRENRAGAYIRFLPGYITRQSHSAARMLRATPDGVDRFRKQKDAQSNWINFIYPLLDERTFEGADPVEFLKGAWDGLVTGNHFKAPGEQANNMMFAFKGPQNLAKRASQSRVLHFKNADAWKTYNDRFGIGSLQEGIVHDIEYAARNTALMETFGTNPRAMFDDVMEKLRNKYRSDQQKVNRFGKPNQGKFEWFYREVDGTAQTAVYPTLAGIGSGIRAIQSMAKLGGATVSALPDLAHQAAELGRIRDANPFAQYGDALGNLTRAAGEDGRVIADRIGIMADSILNSVASRFMANDNIPGALSRMHRMFFKFNLLSPWTTGFKRGFGLLMATDLAENSRLTFDALPQADMLRRFGIDERKWDMLRKIKETAPDGREYMFPDYAQRISDEDIKAYLGEDANARRIQGFKDGLETELRTYYLDRIEHAIPSPTAKERGYMRLGQPAGTVIGETLRFIMQFKAFPLTAARLMMLPKRHTGELDMMQLAHLITMTTMLGYVSYAAKEIAKGRTPPDPADKPLETFMRSFTQGGGAGIYGDILLADSNRFGQGLIASLAGPTFGEFESIHQVYSALLRGEDAGAKALRLMYRNTPYLNHFATRLAVDHLILNDLQEWANPGYLRRMERRVERETGQTFWLPPSG